MDLQTLVAALGIVGAVLAGAIGAFASLHIYRRQRTNLETDEIRRKKVEIVYRLLGARYVLGDNYQPSAEDVLVFNTAMSLFTIYFADNAEIMRRYDAFSCDPNNTDKLVEMLREAARSANIELLDSSLKRVFTVQSTGSRTFS